MLNKHNDIVALARDIASAMPALTGPDRRMAVFIYRTLAGGTPVSVQAIAEHNDATPAEINDRLGAWPEVGRDGQGAVVSFWGLALKGMPHSFEVDGHALTTWCAWDAFFIPGIIGRAADVSSTCPVTGEEIRLHIAADAVSEISPSTAAVSIQRPAKTFGADVVPSF